MSSRRKKSGSEQRFKVGDRVYFTVGMRRLRGIVVEDRGNIGAWGRRLYSIRTNLDRGEDSVIELPAEELKRKRPAA